MEQQSKPNTGALFSGKPKVFKQGTIDINGSPQQVIVTEYENKQGETKYQIYFGVGYFNINTKKVIMKNRQMFWEMLYITHSNTIYRHGKISQKMECHIFQ